MVTPRRIHEPDSIYHVRLRGIAGCPIFAEEEDRKFFLAVLDRHLPANGAAARQWALVVNHAHLEVGVTHTSLSEIMHAVDTEFAVFFNRRHLGQGHVFQDRYWRKVVADESYLGNLSGYIPANVADAGLARLDELATYPWCGFGAVMGTLPARRFHDVEAELAAYSRNPAEARRIITSLTHDAYERMRRKRAELGEVIGGVVEEVCRRENLDFHELIACRFARAQRAREEVTRRCLAAGVPPTKLARALGLGRATVRRLSRRGDGSLPLGQ